MEQFSELQNCRVAVKQAVCLSNFFNKEAKKRGDDTPTSLDRAKRSLERLNAVMERIVGMHREGSITVHFSHTDKRLPAVMEHLAQVARNHHGMEGALKAYDGHMERIKSAQAFNLQYAPGAYNPETGVPKAAIQ